ncbi:MAG TPA: hypothetical protein VD883_02265 [Candidatus Omnitrophota bacterium]|nr:hypothetical protein [Candidatus Omnitrophota bacterium]
MGAIYSRAFLLLSVLLTAFSFRLQGLQGMMREDGPVEWASCVLALLGAYCCFQIISLSRRNSLKRRLWIIGVLGCLFFFVGAEEISWGQRIVGWVPMSGADSGNLQREFNFHNLKALKGPFVLGTSFVLFFVFSAILPVVTYFSKSFKRFWIKTGAPLMPPAVCAGLWMGFIFLSILRHFKISDGGALVYLWDVDVSLQEWREFYYTVPLFAYAFTEYFCLLREGKPYDFEGAHTAPPARIDHLRGFWDDAVFLFFHNKALVLFVLFYLFIASPVLESRLVRQSKADLTLLQNDARLMIIQGEAPAAANSSSYWFSKSYKYFGGKCLYLISSALPEEGYYSFGYTFTVAQDGVYKLFAGSSPPGPIGSERSPNHQFTPYAYSPYRVLLDNDIAVEVSQEKKDNELRKVFKKGNFYSYYNYAPVMAFTKIGTFVLKKGPHTLEFRVNRTQPYAGEYVFGLDAVFIVPQNWKLEGKFKTLPDDIFSY